PSPPSGTGRGCGRPWSRPPCSPSESPHVATLTRPKITAAAPSEEEAALEARLLAAVERRKSPVAAEEPLRAARPSPAEQRRGRTSAVVVPQEQRITVPIVVPRGADGGAADGDMVVAELVHYPGLASEAEARVSAVLGPATDPRVETEAVIAAHDLPREFPPEVAAAARRAPASVPAAALAGRLDLRGLPIVTIDGENARDFDDAVLVEPAGQGFRLPVA